MPGRGTSGTAGGAPPRAGERRPAAGSPGSEAPGTPRGPAFDAGAATSDFLLQPPAVSLPKGGGAIAGIGEKFQSNPATGTASLSVPLGLPPGRSGFGPSLALAYDSGSGNGPFGLGWQVGVPSIGRKTDKGLPLYQDGGRAGVSDLDTFVLSGAEDLVPFLEEQGDGSWRWSVTACRGYEGQTWRVHRYRPRVESGFSLIERWTDPGTGETFWRTITQDNVTRLYGRSVQARVVDPQGSRRVFQWLLEEERDEVGNLVTYEYAAEDRVGVDTSSSAEFTREGACTYRYLKRVRYGNTTPFVRPESTIPETGRWCFVVVFDYGEHDLMDPGWDDDTAGRGAWSVRQDVFSSFRSGFDLRCYRLCRRVLVYHDFDELDPSGPCIVRSTEITYAASAVATKLTGVTLRGWKSDGAGGWLTETLPTLELGYTLATLGAEVQALTGLEDLPLGLDLQRFQWVDLDGEGLAGLLTEAGGAWYWLRNEGSGVMGRLRRLDSQPSLGQAASGGRLVDLTGDGKLDLVVMRPGLAGYQRRDADGRWERFRPFVEVPNLSLDDPDVRLIDLDGDGQADLLVSEELAFRWHPSQGEAGYGAACKIYKAADEDDGPVLVFSRDGESIFLADMSGDGLTDIVRVRNGSVCYWPNLGYGRFGPKVLMDGAPWFDSPDRYDPGRIRLADVDGSGPADLLYLGPDGVRLWPNQSGNSFAAEQTLPAFPGLEGSASIQVADILGDGTACLTWTSSLRADAHAPVRYVRLMSAGKPHLLCTITNNLGRTTTLSYVASTRHYLADREAGRAWATRLPFPVQVLDQVELMDAVTGLRLMTRHAYHHGYFDGEEREFRGFGMVETWDAEAVSDFDTPSSPDIEVQVPPVHTRTWFHTGAWLEADSLLARYEAEFYGGDPSATRPTHAPLPGGLTVEEEREACRALKGRTLRQEVFADDGDPERGAHPYTVAESTFRAVKLQPVDGEVHGCFRVDPEQTITWHYERDPADPRVQHALTLEVDTFGDVTRAAVVSYPRRSGADNEPEQQILTVLVTESDLIDQVDQAAQADPDDDHWHLGVPAGQRTWHLTGSTAWTDASPATVSTVNAAFEAATEIGFEDSATGGTTLEKRCIAHARTLYRSDDLSGALPWGELGRRALPWEAYRRAFTQDLVETAWDGRVTQQMLEGGGYVQLDWSGTSPVESDWWVPSGRQTLDPDLFYQPTALTDPFGSTTVIQWGQYALLPVWVEDALGNRVEAVHDFRVLQPSQLTDPNGNRVAARFDALGRVEATAAMGKEGGGEGDTLEDPTAEFVYELSRWAEHGLPARVHARQRERHGAESPVRWQESYAYSDGGGNVVMTKVQAAPGDAPRVGEDGAIVEEWVQDRWIGTGRVVLDNKGNPVKRYEPFFSQTCEWEDEEALVAWGVTPILRYDPVGRNIETELPDGHLRSVDFDPWRVVRWDENDHDATSPHHGTPSTVHLDAQGRAFLTEEDPGSTSPVEVLRTRLELDVMGNPVTVTDARGNAIQLQRFDMLGRPMWTGSADEGCYASPGGGETWTLVDVAGRPLRTWRSGNLSIRREYDALRRPTELWVNDGEANERLVELRIYGEFLDTASPADPSPESLNLRGRLHRVYDTAGLLVHEEHDLDGNLVATTRQVFSAIDAAVDWAGLQQQATLGELDTWVAAHGGLDPERFGVRYVFDALGRVTHELAPDDSETLYGYDEGGRLDTIDVHVQDAVEATPFVEGIGYNARGQRERIDYGNGTWTEYDYDPLRFRLTRLQTRRERIESPDTSPAGTEKLQDLNYGYDAVGNILQITDDAQETVYFANAQVSPTRTFAYDALYRLTEATGREKVGLAQTTWADPSKGVIPDTGNPALRNYTQRYTYDEVGNILRMKHTHGGGGWERNYRYAELSNQLEATTIPGDKTDFGDEYGYNERGAMTSMPHLPAITRDFRDMIGWVDLKNGDEAYYGYDHAGQRVRKLTRFGQNEHDRIYVGRFEVYRKRVGGVLVEERETLHVMDDQQRICMAETKTWASESPVPEPTPRLRYQYGDHLGTVCLEANHQGSVITYEEFHPYGTTAWWAEKSGIEVSERRYRYTGMEKDEGTGLAYHSARYYAPWLGRWASADPIRVEDGGNRYVYANNCPVRLFDPSGTVGVTDRVDDILQLREPRPHSPPEAVVAVDKAATAGAVQALIDFPGGIVGTIAASGMGGPHDLSFKYCKGVDGGKAPDQIILDTAIDLQQKVTSAVLSTDIGGKAQKLVVEFIVESGDVIGEIPAAVIAGVSNALTTVGISELLLLPLRAVGGARISASQSELGLRFSQKTASPAFSGETIGSLAEKLRAGTVSAADVPVRYVNIGGSNLIVNTRSSLALTRAGIPQRSWTLIDATATDAAAIEARLSSNALTAEGTDVLRITGECSNASSMR